MVIGIHPGRRGHGNRGGGPGWSAGCTLALLLLGTATNQRGQALPPLAPTTPPTTTQTPPPTSAAEPPPQISPERADQGIRAALVTYRTGRLQVTANNSSLNQILREVGRVTGMKISGGVAEERVFGSYGPADPSLVLSALLDGTGSNMMLRFNSARTPAELVLTPRQGGVTPPNPNASRYASREDDLPPDQRRFTPPQSPTYPGAAAVPMQNPATTGAPRGGVPLGAASPSATTTQQSPNGVKTPQEIYDQLMKMQQQQQSPAPPQ